MIYIGIEDNIWYIESNNNRTSKSNEQITKMLDDIKNVEKAYYKNNMKDLVLVVDNQKIVLRNYPEIKNDLLLLNLNKKIRKGLLNTAIDNIKNKKGKLIKNGLIATSVVVVIISGAKIIKGNNPTTIATSSKSSSNVTVEVTRNVPVESTAVTEIQKDEIKELFNQYGLIFGINDTTSLYNQNKNYLLSSSNKEKDVIIILRDYFFENLYLKQPITPNTYTDFEQQKIILKYAKIFEVNDIDTLCTMLAVHRLESGNGEYYICTDQNNLGGIFFNNPDTGEFETKIYPNIDVGAIDFVIEFLNIKSACEQLPEYNSALPLEYNMNLKYCTLPDNPYMPDWNWSSRVSPIKQEIINSGILENYNSLKR